MMEQQTMNNNLIDEHCRNIKTNSMDITVEQLKISFDLFVAAFQESDIPGDKNKLIENIIFSLCVLPHRHKILAQPELIAHELLKLIRDKLIVDKLYQKRTEENMTEKIMLDGTNLFKNLGFNINNSNFTVFKQLLFNKPLIEELAYCLKELGTNGKHLNDFFLLRSLRSLLSIYKHIFRRDTTTDEYSLIAPVFFSVNQCLCSSHAIEMIKSLKQNFYQKLDESQALFLQTMPWYLQWYPEYHGLEYFIRILRTLLNEFTKWLTRCPPDSYLQCSSQIGSMIRCLTCFLVRPIDLDNINNLTTEFYHDYCKLVFQWSSFLSSILKHSSSQTNFKTITPVIVKMLYNFTLHADVLTYMKTIPNLIPMLLRMIDIQHDEIQLYAYRCLGKLMVEDDIKSMAKPGKIARVHIEFIQNTIDDPKRTERFHSLLSSLKNFVQHDQVKTELIQQGALPLLMKCVVETEIYSTKVQHIALEILLSLSFFDEACRLLKQNTDFMYHNKILAENKRSDQSGLQRAAEALLWKLEKEIEAVAKPVILSSHKYHIMISYSHKDKEVCFQIHEKLKKDGFNIWIDKDCLYGSTMIGIASGIENSENVLIFMSNSYKESVYCQAEAHYAFERRCRLIPIMIETDYKPDGWLGIIVSGKIYVDFTKIDFNDAYEKLKNEIFQRESKISSSQSLTNLIEDLNDIKPSLISLSSTEIISETTEELPYCITEWTHDHVRLFLLRMKLGATILPLCTDVDGDRLLQLYGMCLSNRESMYRSLKFELQERHHILLPIADYLAFLHHIKHYTRSTPANVMRSSLSLYNMMDCSIM